MGVVEEFSKLGGTRDTRLYYLMVSTHCMVVMDSSMDIYFGIFRFYMEAERGIDSVHYVTIPILRPWEFPTGRLEICGLATRVCIYANVLGSCIESSFPLSEAASSVLHILI